MTINSKLIKYDASCSTFGDWAIKNKLNISKSNTPKRGDIVLFDFNHNGTSDHVGIVTGANGNTVYTIEGNTSITSNDNGGCVMKRSRTKSQINYFVRPKYTEEVTAEMVVQTALAEVGTKESPSGSNRCKYNTWFYGREVRGSAYPWCMVFVSWCYAHVKEKETKKETKKKYTGKLPSVSSAEKSVAFAKKQKGTYAWRGKNHHKYSNKFTKYFAGKYGIDSKGQFPKYKNDIAGDCDLFAFGYVLSNTGVPQTEIMDAMGKTWWWWSSNLYRHLKARDKLTHTPKAGDVAFYSKGGKICTHICFVVKVNGNKITTMDKNGASCKTYTRVKSNYIGFYRPSYKPYYEKGNKGTEIGYIQSFLKWYGYDITVDENFGEETETAVKKFQKSVGLAGGGKVGEKTIAKMKEAKR